MASQVELTPCGAMFDIFKRAAHLSHIELCGLVLSSRPLADGRSPQSRAADRSWVSRFIVRAPVGTLQHRYFAEYGTSAARIMSQLALRQRNPMDSTAVINMVCGPAGEPMVRALEECHQDTNLYRNALGRLSQAAELMPAERAEAVLVLFVAVGCSADVRSSVNYAIDYAHATCGGGTSTPRSLGMSMTAGEREPAPAHPLGLLRVQNSFVVSAPRWIQPSEQGVEIGALATGEGDITDVGDDVSARHAHIWCDAQNIWHVEDLSSSNGTVVVNGATRVCIQVEPGRSPNSIPATSSSSANPLPTPSSSVLSSRQIGTFLFCRHLGTLLGAPEPVARGWRGHFGPWRSVGAKLEDLSDSRLFMLVEHLKQ